MRHLFSYKKTLVIFTGLPYGILQPANEIGKEAPTVGSQVTEQPERYC